MDIDELMRILTLAQKPVGTGSGMRWESVETELGTRLPEDYKAFVRIFGVGGINDFLFVFSPFSENGHFNLVLQLARRGPGLFEFRREFPADVPYKVFPEPGGLIPWGADANADTLFWLANGEPEQWTTVVADIRSAQWEEHPCTMTGFLVRLLRGELRSRILPDDFPGQKVLTFRPLGCH